MIAQQSGISTTHQRRPATRIGNPCNVAIGDPLPPATPLSGAHFLRIVQVRVSCQRLGSQTVIPACMRSVASMYSSTILRSEEHTSELQSLRHLVCRVLLEKK